MPPRPAKSAANAKIQQSLAVRDDSEDENDFTSLNEESEHGDSNGNRNSRSTRVPPAKRAKLSQLSSPRKEAMPAKQPARRRKSLSLLLTMPLDILFEIFGFLLPKDIINLAKTNKLFRQTLLSSQATTVWKTARERLDAPECPTDMTEPRWAALLFGNSCQNCSAKNVQKIDFLIRRRICTVCKKNNLIVRSKFKTNFPEVEMSILDLISPTNVGGWAHGHASGSQFYWKSDITNMIHTLAVYQADVHKRLKGSMKTLEEFKSSRREQVQNIQADAPIFAQWAATVVSQRTEANEDIYNRRFEAITNKFIELGYTLEDISSVSYHDECRKKGGLSDRVWERIRPLLEPDVSRSKNRRVASRHFELKTVRRMIVNDLYQTYKLSVRPSQWKYLPTVYNICTLEPFRLLVEADIDTDVTATDFSGCIDQLPELLAAAADDLKTRLRNLILAAKHPAFDAIPVTEPGLIEDEYEGNSLAQNFRDLELATLGLRCGNCPGLVIGWDDIAMHHCTKPDKGLTFNPYSFLLSPDQSECSPSFYFDERIVTAAQTVLQVAGFDTTTTLASQMDAADLRFSCTVCSCWRNGTSQCRRQALTWRSAVRHIAHYVHGKGSQVTMTVSMTVLSASDSELVKTEEWEKHRFLWPNYTCNHCSVFMGRLDYRLAVLQHVQTTHGIPDPQEPDDLFLFTRTRMDPHIDYPVPAPPLPPPAAKNAKCVHCNSHGKPSARCRLFDEMGVISHIKAKHLVDNPKKGVDWAPAK